MQQRLSHTLKNLAAPVAITAALFLPNLSGPSGPEQHAALREATLDQISATAKVDGRALMITSAGPAHLIAGAPPAPRTGAEGLLGHVLLAGQGPWRGGERLPDGVYQLRRGAGNRMVELVSGERVIASFTLDFPTLAGDAAALWPRIYLAVVRELIPAAH